MKWILASLLFSLFGLSSASASTTGRAHLQCRDMGSSVCAVNTRTGQCTHSWSHRDGQDARRACLVYTGQIETRVDRSNYSCSGSADRACARSHRTGQCTHEWTSEDGNALSQCRRWMGLERTTIDRSNLQCRHTGNGACAVNLRTGQCTHSWANRDGGMDSCLRWIRR